MKPKCEDCRYLEKMDDETQGGICRRYAPSPFQLTTRQLNDEHLSLWPVVCDEDWCGEFKERESSPAPKKQYIYKCQTCGCENAYLAENLHYACGYCHGEMKFKEKEAE